MPVGQYVQNWLLSILLVSFIFATHQRVPGMFKKSNVGPLGAENDDSRLKIGLIVAWGAQYLAQKYIKSRVKNLEFQPQTARILPMGCTG